MRYLVNFNSFTAMVFPEIISSLFLAMLLTLIFSFGFRNRGPWGSIWSFFIILFLGIWAASFWIIPAGPVYGGIAWLPLLMVGLVLALLLAAAIPSSRSVRQPNRVKPHPNPVPDWDEARVGTDEEPVLVALSAFFWIALTLLVVVVIIGYTV